MRSSERDQMSQITHRDTPYWLGLRNAALCPFPLPVPGPWTKHARLRFALIFYTSTTWDRAFLAAALRTSGPITTISDLKTSISMFLSRGEAARAVSSCICIFPGQQDSPTMPYSGGTRVRTASVRDCSQTRVVKASRNSNSTSMIMSNLRSMSPSTLVG